MTTKIGRNETCSCGSGLKYKHCHGDVVKTAIAKQVANEVMLLLIAETRHKKDLISGEQFLEIVHDPKHTITQLIKQFNLRGNNEG